MNKVAIIGANSYIARNLHYIFRKHKKNYQIDLYDYQSTFKDSIYKRYQQINFFDINSISQIDMNVDVIYIFSGKTGSINGFDEFSEFIDINEKVLLNILNEYKSQHSKAKIIFPSTRLIYKGKKGKLKEDSEKEQRTIYAMNKYSCERYLEMYHNVFGIEYIIFRICLPYGTLIENASSYGTVEFMINKASLGNNISLYGDGSLRRTLTYIEDLCDILIEGAFSNECKNDIYNIGGEDYSLKEMAKIIAKKYNVSVEYIPWPSIALSIEGGDTVFDSSKLDKIIDKKYKMKFKDWCR